MLERLRRPVSRLGHNVIEGIWRAGIKSKDPVEDLRKASWYINREIERLTRPSRPGSK